MVTKVPNHGQKMERWKYQQVRMNDANWRYEFTIYVWTGKGLQTKEIGREK